MPHRRHSNESDHHPRITVPILQSCRSKSYPRDDRQKRNSSGNHKYKKHKTCDHYVEELVVCSSKKHHHNKKKHEKSEKDKYNVDKYFKEKHKKPQIKQHHPSLESFDLVNTHRHSRKSKEKIPKQDPLLDMVNIEYYIAPVQVSKDKGKFRSKSGEEKRSNAVIGISNKIHSRSQGDCKHKHERNHFKSHGDEKLELFTNERRTHRKSSTERKQNSSSKAQFKPKKYRDTRSPTEPLYSGLYKFFHLEKSAGKNKKESANVKYYSKQHDSAEVISEKKKTPTKRKHGREKRKPREDLYRKSEEDVKKYLIKIQNMIDEKLNSFLRKTASISEPPDTRNSDIQKKKERHRKRHRNSFQEHDVKEFLAIDDQEESLTNDKSGETLQSQEVDKKSEELERRSQHSVQKAPVKEKRSCESKIHKYGENSRNSSARDPKSDSTPRKSRASLVCENSKLRAPEKKNRTLECKTVSIVSIIPRELKDKMLKVVVKSPDMLEEILERKKKSRRFQKYYNYCYNSQIDSENNSSADRSIASDCFRNVQGSCEKTSSDIHSERCGSVIFSDRIIQNEYKVDNLTPYWIENNEKNWRPKGTSHSSHKETFLHLQNPNRFPSERRKHVTIKRSRIDDGFVKIYSNKGLTIRESSSDSLLSKSSIRSSDKTKINVKLIVAHTQGTKESGNASRTNLEQCLRDGTLEYMDHTSCLRNQPTEDRMTRIERLLNKSFFPDKLCEDTLFPKQKAAAFKVPKTFISKLLEGVSPKTTSDVGVETVETVEEIENKKNRRQEKSFSDISVQADLLSFVPDYNKKSFGTCGKNFKKLRDTGVYTTHHCIEQMSLKNTEDTTVKDQYVQISLDLTEIEKLYKKNVRIETSTKSLGVSTSLPFLRDTKRMESTIGETLYKAESTVTSLVCLHRFHGDRISSSNKSNSHSLNDYFIRPLVGSSPRRSSLFLTKQYKSPEQSSYQKRKMYDEKIRKRMKRRIQHNKELAQPVFEVRFVTVDTSSQSNPFSSSKEVTTFCHPAVRRTIYKSRRAKPLKKNYGRNIFSYAIQDVDMLWKTRKKRNQKKGSESNMDPGLKPMETKTENTSRISEEVPNLKGVIDFICKSLVTYYQNTNFREPSNESKSKKFSKKSVEALFYSDHFQKESSTSNSFSDVASTASDSKFTRSAGVTSTSSTKCICCNNSCPTLQSADSFFENPDMSEKDTHPTILGYALDNKINSPDSYGKNESTLDISEESGYGSDRTKKKIAKDFFKKPMIAALLSPNNDQKATTDYLYSEDIKSAIDHTCMMKSKFHSSKKDISSSDKESKRTLASPKWSRNLISDHTMSTQEGKTLFQNSLNTTESKSNVNTFHLSPSRITNKKKFENLIDKSKFQMKPSGKTLSLTRFSFEEKQNVNNDYKQPNTMNKRSTQSLHFHCPHKTRKSSSNILKPQRIEKKSNNYNKNVSWRDTNYCNGSKYSREYVGTYLLQDENTCSAENNKKDSISIQKEMVKSLGTIKKPLLRFSSLAILMEKWGINDKNGEGSKYETRIDKDVRTEASEEKILKASKRDRHHNNSCLPSNDHVAEEKLFDLIERDLRQIYNPSTRRGDSFRKRMKMIFHNLTEKFSRKKNCRRNNEKLIYKNIFTEKVCQFKMAGYWVVEHLLALGAALI